MDLGKIMEIDIGRCLRTLADHWKWILGTTLIGLFIGIVGAFFVLDTQNIYDARSSVYSIAYGSYSESADGITAIQAYSEIVKSLRVAERAALLLGDDSLDKFAIYDMIEIETPALNAYGYPIEESSIINIHARSTVEEDAIRVANAVANAYVMEVTSITMSGSVRVLDEAYQCEVVYNAPKQQLICIGLGAVIGIVLGCIFFVLREIFSRNIETVKQGSLYGDLDIIGVIPVQKSES